jgi:hypothetical protein
LLSYLQPEVAAIGTYLQKLSQSFWGPEFHIFIDDDGNAKPGAVGGTENSAILLVGLKIPGCMIVAVEISLQSLSSTS